MQLCVSVQIPTCFEGLQAEAIYVDTNSNFSQLRLTGKNHLLQNTRIKNEHYINKVNRIWWDTHCTRRKFIDRFVLGPQLYMIILHILC